MQHNKKTSIVVAPPHSIIRMITYFQKNLNNEIKAARHNSLHDYNDLCYIVPATFRATQNNPSSKIINPPQSGCAQIRVRLTIGSGSGKAAR